MTNLTAANTARLNAALDKKYRFSHGVDSFRGMIEAGEYAKSAAATVPKIQYSRRKFNRMNYAEQAAYEKKLAETKTEYRLYYAADPLNSPTVSIGLDTFTVVPKLVFDWFNERNA